jgi:hypothetical protein
MKRTLIVISLLISITVSAQNITGILINENGNKPVEFVNIGIAGKNVGTVSDMNGKFSLLVDAKYDNDTLMISCIGYNPLTLKISDLRKNQDIRLMLQEKTYALHEVVIKPKAFRQKTLGVTTKLRNMQAGFKENLLGYECGVLMKNRKAALIKKVDIHIASCSYDTIFYRLNIYEVNAKKVFVNILKEPIYIKMPKDQVNKEIQIDLTAKNIIVVGDFVVTLEHVKDLGQGNLYFCAGLMDKTYYRKTSQGKWETAPVGVSISVLADVEK